MILSGVVPGWLAATPLSMLLSRRYSPPAGNFLTFISVHSLHAAAVERFRLALLEANQSRLLKKVFTKDIRYTMSPEAAVIIKGEKLSTGLLAIFPRWKW